MNEYGIDEPRARRAFERAAPTYFDAARLEREVGARMLERLELIRLEPGTIVDAGAGPGPQAEGLRRRYARALYVPLDTSLAMLREQRARSGWMRRVFSRRSPAAVCADMRGIPLAAGSCGLVWSNMALHWMSDPVPALREFGRVLRPEGLLMFSTLGPDTLKELRGAWEAAGAGPQAHRFRDMHDLGDMLTGSGFSSPVVDMEIITMSFASVAALVADLRATGQSSSAAGRRRTLTGKHRWAAVREMLESRAVDGRLAFTAEVVYGHAWKGSPQKAPDTSSIVRFQRAPQSRR
ncbi:MAG: methyltransferase domain-containing protein [Betaproteobacteria bacterium]|nr:methyltransferase domain-containing protein [Betaproteobacteria bacterium]